MVAPTIVAHAQPAVVDRYVRSMYRGTTIGCQLFSEPEAGSDLAGLRMRAERDGDEWVLNGQKVWTSLATFAQIGEVLCRTNSEVPKHRGLTALIVDMSAPGVEIRPLRQMSGGATFNEVFFTDVRVADDHRLGDVDGGWGVAMTTLMNERAAIGGGGTGAGLVPLVERLIQMVRHRQLSADPLIRQRLASIVAGVRIAEWTQERALQRVLAGELPGPEMSLGKLALTANSAELVSLAATVLGPSLAADTGEWGTFAWNELLLTIPGLRIAGGTDEVMRNIIGERVLGLPRDRP
jgi:acyl-CoA dehydrogenase